MSARTPSIALLAAFLSSGMLPGCAETTTTGTLSFAPTTTASIAPPPGDILSIKTMIALATLMGPTEDGSRAIVRELDKAATRAQMALLADSTLPPRYTLRGYVLASSTSTGVEVSYVWDVFDSNGVRVARNAGSETIPGVFVPSGTDVWAVLEQPVLARIADAAIAATTTASNTPQFGKTATLRSAVR